MTQSELALQALERQYGTEDRSRFRVRRWCHWDWVRYPVAGTTQLSFFTNPQGSVDPVSSLTKTREQTNLNKANEFDEAFVFVQCRTHIHLLPKKRQASAIQAIDDFYAGAANGVNDALTELAQQGVLSISFGDKRYYDISQPFLRAPAGFGPDVETIPVLAAANDAATNNRMFFNDNDPSDAYQIDPITVIERGQTMSVRLDFPNGTSPTIPQVESADVAVNVGVLFYGFKVEPVQ